jgi:hypothetical protein
MANPGGIKRTRGTGPSWQENDGPPSRNREAPGPLHGVRGARAGARNTQAVLQDVAPNEIDDWQGFSLAQMLWPWPPKTERAAPPHSDLPLGNHHVWSPCSCEIRTLDGEPVVLNEFSVRLIEVLVLAKGRRIPSEDLAEKARFPSRCLSQYLCCIRKIVPGFGDYNKEGYRIAMGSCDMDGPTVVCGPLTLHVDQRTVARGGECVGLQTVEFFMLLSLLESKEAVFVSTGDLQQRMQEKSAKVPQQRATFLGRFNRMKPKLAKLVNVEARTRDGLTRYRYTHLTT